MENFSCNTSRNREREWIGINILSFFLPLYPFLSLAFLCFSVPDKLSSAHICDVWYPWPQPPSPSDANRRSRLLRVVAALFWQPGSGMRRFSCRVFFLFFFSCHPISQCSLSGQFDTHRQTSLLASPVQLWAVSPTDLHFPVFSFPSLSFFLSKRHPVLPHWWPSDTYFWALLRLWDYIVAALWRADAPTDTSV